MSIKTSSYLNKVFLHYNFAEQLIKTAAGKSTDAGLVFRTLLHKIIRMEKKSLEETAAFIREHRGNENNFAALHARLEEEADRAGNDYKTILQEIKEKQAAEYLTAKETDGTAWPEFEKFASSFEKAVIDALHTAS